MSFLSGLFHTAVTFTKDHWKALTSLAVSAAVFSAIVFFAPVSMPALLTMAIAGFVSGATGAIVRDLLDKHAPTIKDVLISAVISTVLSMGSFGVGKGVLALFPKLWEPVADWVVRPAVSLIGRPAVTSITNAAATIATPIIENAVKAVEISTGQLGAEIARDLKARREAAASSNATNVPPAAPADALRTKAPGRATDGAPPETAAPPPSASQGLIGALSASR